MNIVRKVMTAIMRKLWWFLQRFGFEVRRSEQFCWPDQIQLSGKDARIVFDVGASSGGVAEHYLKMFPNASVHCFEPIPEDAVRCQERFMNDSRFVVNNCALGEHRGNADFHLNAKQDTSSLLESDVETMPVSYVPLLKTDQVIKVKLEDIDSYCDENGIDFIDILKMDVQGGELGVLEGASRMLESEKIGIIYTEVFFTPMYNEQPLFGTISAFLAKHGYCLHSLYNIAFNGHTGRIQWGDAIFICPEKNGVSMDLLRRAQRP